MYDGTGEAAGREAQKEPSPAHSFRVGDRVRILNTTVHYRGKTAIVTNTDHPRVVSVRLESEPSIIGGFWEDELEIVSRAPAQGDIR